MFRPPIDRCVCPKYQSELTQNLCSLATWHLYIAHRVVFFFFLASPAALLLTCVLSASSEEKQEINIVISSDP